MKVDDSYKHVDGGNEGNYGSQTKFERHIVFAGFHGNGGYFENSKT
jgi:hypothetical protein